MEQEKSTAEHLELQGLEMSWEEPSTAAGHAHAKAKFSELLKWYGWDENQKLFLEGFDEAVINGIMHGNGAKQIIDGQRVIKDNPAKKIEILVKMDRNKIYASVKDEGSGFIVEKIIKDEEARVAQTEPENPGGDTGRGLTLMRDYDISYEDNGSKIILTHPKKNFRIK